MDSAISACISLRNETETTALGQRLAPLLLPGDAVLLAGTIGAGKTHLARAIIQARLASSGQFEEVPSPTYTLVQTYGDGVCEIWHVDLYRIASPDEAIELGIVQAFESAIVLVEWPDRLGDLVPDDALSIQLEARGTGRTAKFTCASPRWTPILLKLDQAS